MNKTDKIFGAISKTIGKTGTYFMFVFIFISSLAKLLGPGKNDVNLTFFAWALLFCFILAIADFILDAKVLGIFPMRVVIHFVIALADFIAVLCYFSGYASNGKQVVYLSVFFTLVYAICMTVCSLVRSSKLRKENKEKTYKNEFSGTNE